MQIDHPKQKCQNPDCNCEVEAGHPYCSEHCRSAAEFDSSAENTAGKDACNCGHDTCSAKE